jgi:farnesyl diphosphate synthase
MDNDDLRRGEPTTHIKYGENTAILAGDSLHSLAFELLAAHDYQQTTAVDVIEMIKLLSHHGGYPGMCGGQAIDLASVGIAIDLGTLERMHRLKTGALIKCAVLMASYCASGFSRQDRRHLSDFADTLGHAFQVQDDILDVVGDTAVLGKPSGSDLIANKSTYVSLLGLEQAKDKANTLYLQSIRALQQLPYDTQLLQAFAAYVVQRNH